jgi:thiol-disulfide isomerase/thioredoxin
MYRNKIVIAVIVVGLIALLSWMNSRRLDFFGTQTKVEYFYMEGCPWCEKFMPEWEKFQEKAATLGVEAKKTEASEDPEKIKQYNIHGFPTVIITKNGKAEEFTGDRTMESLMKAVTA